jgi:DNA-binding NarL/FixJ family response regulator
MQLELLTVEKRVRITPREREILSRLINGQKWDVIASELGICQRTVHFHLCNVKAKLGAQRTVDVLIFFALHAEENFS